MNNSKNLIAKAKKFYLKKSFFEAKTCLLQALKNPQLNETLKMSLYILVSDVCYKINEFENAEKYLLKYIYIDKSNAKVFNLLGNIYLKKRDYINSEKFYLESIKIDEINELALVNLAILYHNLGKQKKAISFYKKILSINPKNIGALYNLASIDQSSIDEKKIENLKNLLKEEKLDNFNIASCYFLLAEYEKKKKNFDQEVGLLLNANKFSFKNNESINKQSNEYWFNIISNKFNKIEYLQNKKILIENKEIYPIFIIGLPRCGSTLIESIISSGKVKVENLGETNLVNWAFLNTNRDILRFPNEKKIAINFDLTAEKLKNSFDNLNVKDKNKKIFFSEKSLENFYYIELLLNIYPNAKFINPYRNLIDNTFAIYKQFLSNISWSHSLEDILLYINNYLFTIDYFKQRYPNKIFSISLENFTENPKKSAMDIYKFCNLKWDEKCLEFHKRNDLFTNTASINQIRTSVQKYDKNKYDPYKKILNKYLDRFSWLNNS